MVAPASPSVPTCPGPIKPKTPWLKWLAVSAGSMPWSTWRVPFAGRRLPTSPRSDFDEMIAANLAAPYHAAIAAARQMLTQPGRDGIKGKIVNHRRLGDRSAL